MDSGISSLNKRETKKWKEKQFHTGAWHGKIHVAKLSEALFSVHTVQNPL